LSCEYYYFALEFVKQKEECGELEIAFCPRLFFWLTKEDIQNTGKSTRVDQFIGCLNYLKILKRQSKTLHFASRFEAIFLVKR